MAISEIMTVEGVFVPKLAGKIVQFNSNNPSIARYYMNFYPDANTNTDRIVFSSLTPDEYNNGAISTSMLYLIMGVITAPNGEKFIHMMIRYNYNYWYKYDDIKPLLKDATFIYNGGVAKALYIRLFSHLESGVVI
ncbi:hypothetical protein [Lactobacillus hominis]|uniref:Uncharacterized protein n=1 Tax=Lactobacillus hominis DSM 23910 = CRBIP 24.179 TaxID=1423758 RepID=I7KI18_9LACO|nr:hypothetical protein [Lactobacillus hominis]KRM84173.1 hypothetical protein FC41_GL001475 [Lactobacillus hominis DSM 23910 = CRBIP 24.179]MCT3348377.1 hypothetical protein [Lactobacillus hominis]CCI82615.1 Protein of unknown function [Lactobacillus hominis DSM 23910 = CRBIP 24.179]